MWCESPIGNVIEEKGHEVESNPISHLLRYRRSQRTNFFARPLEKAYRYVSCMWVKTTWISWMACCYEDSECNLIQYMRITLWWQLTRQSADEIRERESWTFDLCEVMMNCRQSRLSAITDRWIVNVHIAMSAYYATSCSSVEDMRHPPICLPMWIMHLFDSFVSSMLVLVFVYTNVPELAM